MTCDHCGFNCTHRGSDMSLSTFKNALTLCENWDSAVQLGGGEPTIHPKFWEFLGLSLSVGDVWLATNGSITDIALRLCKMARRGVISCALSRDYYHDDIDYDVVEAFQDGMTRSLVYKNGRSFYSDFGYSPDPYSDYDRREIRDNSHNIRKRGRAVKNELWHNDKCTCDAIIVKPNGEVRGCGCPRAPKFGNVNTEVNIPEDWEHGTCYKEQPELELV